MVKDLDFVLTEIRKDEVCIRVMVDGANISFSYVIFLLEVGPNRCCIFTVVSIVKSFFEDVGAFLYVNVSE